MKSIHGAILRYQATNTIKSASIYYGILFLVLVSLEILLRVFASSGNAVINNLEFSSSIFLFVMGLNILKADLKFYSANGLTRKQLFVSVMINSILLTGFMVLIDTVFGLVYSQIVNYVSFSQGFFSFMYEGQPAILAFLFLWTYYLFIFMIGFFVSNVYYKLNAIGKVVVSVAVPGFFLIGLPYIDVTYFNFTLMKQLYEGFISIMGIYPIQNPWYGIITLLVAGVISSMASFGLMRRAILKDA